MVRYRCQKCGAFNSRWTRHCIACGKVGTLVRPEVYGCVTTFGATSAEHEDGLERLGEIESNDVPRLSTGMPKLDETLGGGIAYPSVVMLSGSPGVGKSTLLLQIANHQSENTLYCSSEELGRFIAARSKRMKLKNAARIRFLASSSPSEIKDKILKSGVKLVILDSLQGLRSDPFINEHGKEVHHKHTQLAVRDMALDITNFALMKDEYEDRPGHPVSVIVISHINKDGDTAGLVEIAHMADGICAFEGEKSKKRRKFSVLKHRFGPNDLVASFDMCPTGLVEVEPEDEEEDEDESETPIRKQRKRGRGR